MLKKWLRNKLAGPVYVDCYTVNSDVYNTSRIKTATYYYPKWWKRLLPTVGQPVFDELPKLTRPASTMRHCVGFTDLFKKSFCLPLWSDLMLHVEPAMQAGHAWKFADGRSTLGEHPSFQRGDFMPPEHFQHIKLNSPWHLRCEEEINFLFFDPFWPSYEGEETVIIPPGLLSYQHQSATNINLFVRKLENESRTVDLKFNTPLVFLTPLTDRKVILRYHLVSAQEMADVTRPQVAFVDSYLQAKKAKIETKNQAKEEQTNV
jgi:hypothetical protein